MHLRNWLLCGILAGAAVYAQDTVDWSKIKGTWSEDGNPKATWVLSDQGTSVHLVRSEGDKKLAEFSCAVGSECEVKDSGQKVKVTMYFNGPKLIELETRGEKVVKRIFTADANGNGLGVEVVPVAPTGKTETQHMTRVASAVASK